MAEIEHDLLVHCENDNCEKSEGEPEFITVNGDESDTFFWTCSSCRSEYEFEVEMMPEIMGFRVKL